VSKLTLLIYQYISISSVKSYSASARIISEALGENRHRQQVSLWCTSKKPIPTKCIDILLEYLRKDNMKRRDFFKNAKASFYLFMIIL
jgi:hypothetical protein